METDQPLTSPDSTMRIFPTVTNQPSISAFDCQKLMKQVNAFRAAALDGWDGGKLEVLITGRSAYVAEISLSMRHDIVATVLSSIVLVGAVFFIGFRRWLPLLGMGSALLLCCLIGLAAGLLIFHRLNMVTVGFCAILVGLGVDFAILIYGRYQQARSGGLEHRAAVADAVHSLGRAVFFGALTTAVGFLALVLSNSSGFIQLGVLIAIGISAAGLLMTTVFFSIRSASTCATTQRLDFGFGKNLCASDARPTAIDPHNQRSRSAHLIDCRYRAPISAHLRGERTIARAEKQSRRNCSQFDYAENAGALGTGAWNCPRFERAAVARFLEGAFRPLGRVAAGREDKELLHSERACSFTSRDATKSSATRFDRL